MTQTLYAHMNKKKEKEKRAGAWLKWYNIGLASARP
jgi:hypothetical protein